MDILNQTKEDFNKPELERIQKAKQEFKLIDTILRTRGLNLYAYDSRKDIIFMIKIARKANCHTKIQEGQLVVDNDKNYDKSMIDPRNEHFESLNMKNAEKRVEKYKKGIINELSNLKRPTNFKLKLW